jgi:hypothetical protein
LDGRDVLNEATAVLDGRPVASGDNISLNPHHLTITHPRTEPFTTNFSGWHGRHDLGKITLTRARGNLNVTAEPAAKWIAISGPEFSLTLSNSTGTNVLIPTDTYHVSVRYANWAEARDFPVSAERITSYGFNPQFGAIALTGNALAAAHRGLRMLGRRASNRES